MLTLNFFTSTLFTTTVGLGFLAGLLMILIYFHERREDSKPIRSWPFWLTIISAVIIIGTSIKTQLDSNVASTYQDSLMHAYKVLAGKNDKIQSLYEDLNIAQKAIVDSTNEVMNLQNQLIKKQNSLEELAKDNAVLQKEVVNYVAGAHAFPLVTGRVAGVMKLMVNSPSQPVESLLIEIKKIGEYPITNIEVTLKPKQRYFISVTELPSFAMSGTEPRTLVEVDLTNYSLDELYPDEYYVEVKWKTYSYTYRLVLVENTNKQAEDDFRFAVKDFYIFGSSMYSKNEFLKAMNKSLK